jgi:hypothetical protein
MADNPKVAALLEGFPGYVVEVLREILDDLAVELGESPEAWRGACKFAAYACQLMNTGVEADAHPDQLMALVGAFAALTVDHPLAHAARQAR